MKARLDAGFHRHDGRENVEYHRCLYTYEDDQFAYGELRLVTLGLLQGVPVSIVHTETEAEIRIISFRKATKREAEILFQNF